MLPAVFKVCEAARSSLGCWLVLPDSDELATVLLLLLLL